MCVGGVQGLYNAVDNVPSSQVDKKIWETKKKLTWLRDLGEGKKRACEESTG